MDNNNIRGTNILSLTESPIVNPNMNNNLVMGYGGIPVTYNFKMREMLPAFIPENQSYSIWAILKDVIGKDLTRITMPIWLNEPISMLQRIAELTAFHNIMEEAIKTKDDHKRIALIGIFILS